MREVLHPEAEANSPKPLWGNLWVAFTSLKACHIANPRLRVTQPWGPSPPWPYGCGGGHRSVRWGGGGGVLGVVLGVMQLPGVAWALLHGGGRTSLEKCERKKTGKTLKITQKHKF